MPPDTNSRLCPDWIFLCNSNAHVAKDRGWFTTYTPFTSTVDASPFFGSKHCPVLGIGTVVIHTKRSPNLRGEASHGSLLLHDVLHVPDFVCNTFGQPIMYTDGYDVIYGGRNTTKSNGVIKDSQGKNVAYFDPKSPLLGIKVRSPPNGPMLGPHALKKDRLYMLGCQWDAAEKRRWQEFKDKNGIFTPRPHATPYTAEEKAFLKKNYRSEYHFLVQHGLKIHVDEDRDEGRAILRAIMHEDDDFEDSEDEEPYTPEETAFIKKNYGSEYDFLFLHGLKTHTEEDRKKGLTILRAIMHEVGPSEDEVPRANMHEEELSEDEESEDEFAQFEGHQADYNFTEDQLEWIEKHYGNSEQFMICYGLKFYDDEDLDEAKAIAEAMMRGDD